MTVSAGVAGGATVPFARSLADHGDRVALISGRETLTYRQLADRVDELARRLGPDRRLVLLAGGNEPDAVIGYLAALAAGHPLLLAPGDRPDHLAALTARYDPDVVLARDPAGWRMTRRRDGTAHELHPDLALLLSTSGSTGSARLVRLSHHNLLANAEAIAGYLQLDEHDRAATTLPMHYCYGLSVINTHLLRGASLILTDRSVTDDDFWEEFRRHRGTSFAGVPYTFELLDRVGFDAVRLPHLRYLTQAGGAMPPERVRRYAELGHRHGWRLFVMYGQTEATARMAYLPPELATTRPEFVGVPVPGGSFRLDPLPEWPEPDTGELVYQGPNVMLGYAEHPADLRLGRVVGELRTGDVARREDGLYRIVGRRSRFVKMFGLRIDLAEVETSLAGQAVRAAAVADGDELAVAVEGDLPPRTLVAHACGLPARAVRVVPVPELPRLSNGKPDYPAVRELVRAERAAGSGGVAGGDGTTGTTGGGTDAGPAPAVALSGGWRGVVGRTCRRLTGRGGDADRDLVRLFAEVLGRDDVTGDSTFAGLGGDSLSYVEMSVRLERALGRLPGQWHLMPIRELRASDGSGRAAGRTGGRRPATLSRMDTSVVLRAVSIVLIVGTHAALFPLAGGAHLLLGVAGFNFARFHLTAAPRWARVRHAGRSLARLAGASAIWIALAAVVTGDYSLANVLLVNYLFGTETATSWHFWFIETLVYLQLAVLVLLALPVVDRVERRFPFGLPMALAGAGLVTRYELVPGVELATPLVVGWLFALGWAGARATTRWRRLLVTAAVVATVPGFFGDLRREAVIVAGLVLLVWVARLPGVRPLDRLVATLAGSSLFIYLTHWQVYPELYRSSPVLAVAASLAVGVGYAVCARWVVDRWPWVRRLVGRWRAARPGGGPPSPPPSSPSSGGGPVGSRPGSDARRDGSGETRPTVRSHQQLG